MQQPVESMQSQLKYGRVRKKEENLKCYWAEEHLLTLSPLKKKVLLYWHLCFYTLMFALRFEIIFVFDLAQFKNLNDRTVTSKNTISGGVRKDEIE